MVASSAEGFRVQQGWRRKCLDTKTPEWLWARMSGKDLCYGLDIFEQGSELAV